MSSDSKPATGAQDRIQSPLAINQFINDLKRLHDRIRTVEVDRRFSKEGQVFYAIDTNILDLYISPKEMGCGSNSVPGYTRIFHDDPDELAWSIAQETSSTIFFPRLGPDNSDEWHASRPLLLLPGIDREVFRRLTEQLEGIAVTSAQTRALSSAPAAKAHLDRMRSLPSSEKYTYLEKNLPEVFDIIFGPDGATKKAARIKNLAENSKIISVRALDLKYASVFPPLFIDGLRETWSAEGTKRRARISADVARALESVDRRASGRKSSRYAQGRRRDNDIEALNWLISANEYLADRGFRIAQVTGAETIIRAGKQLFVGVDGKYVGTNPTIGSRSVSELYLRHPLQFWQTRVDDPVDTGTDELQTFGDAGTFWLNLVLPSRMLSSNVAPTKSFGSGTRFAAQLERFRDGWNHLSALLVAKYGSQSGISSREIEEIFRDIDGFIDKSVDEVFTSSAALGLALLVGSDVSSFPRNPPTVVFDSNQTADDAVRRIQDLLTSNASSPSKDSMKSAFSSLQSGSSHPYFFELGLATVYSSEQQYRAASICANRAVGIARSLPNDVSVRLGITGREAFYLLSICTRLLARSLEDYRQAELYAALARDALRQDRQVNPSLGVTEARFIVEDAARSVGKSLFRVFRLDDESDVSGVREVAQLWTALNSLTFGASEKHLISGLKLKMLINELSLFIHLRKHRSRVLESEGLRREFTLKVENAISALADGSRKVRKLSFLHICVLSVSRFLLSGDANFGIDMGLPAQLSTFERLLSKENIASNSVTAYDTDRFCHMRSLVGLSNDIE
jgi:hypothetical protein